jgi:hypothetical protein
MLKMSRLVWAAQLKGQEVTGVIAATFAYLVWRKNLNSQNVEVAQFVKGQNGTTICKCVACREPTSLEEFRLEKGTGICPEGLGADGSFGPVSAGLRPTRGPMGVNTRAARRAKQRSRWRLPLSAVYEEET